MKSTFQRNLLVGFGLSLFLLIVSSVASYISIKNLLTSVEEVQRTDKIISTIENVLSTLKDAETGQRGYLLTGRDKFLEPYTGAYDAAMSQLAIVKEMTASDAVQQKNCMELANVIAQRLKQLQTLIDIKREKNTVDFNELERGKMNMDEARRIVKDIAGHEETVLQERTTNLNKSASNTPLLILVAAVLSVVITLVFFVRINSDFNRRQQLQKELQDKDEDIARRIHIIQGIAEKISSGDYAVRAEDAGADGLGNLSVSVNKMAESLAYSFNLLSDKEWLQAGIAKLNVEMIGDVDIESLSAKVIRFVAVYTDSQVGLIYTLDDEHLELSGSIASTGKESRQLELGEGLAGQVAVTGKTMHLDNIPEANILISYATGTARPSSVIAFPVFFENKVTGVIELASLTGYTANHISFLENAAPAIGTAIMSAASRRKLQELLEETQSQSEELQAQHNELENVNAELEMQAQRLQASDEEMKVQQEELIHANNELEEKARQLEEKNQLINERNLLIQNKAEQLAASTKYKSEFLANMSHELRTPLNSILLLSRLMSDNNDKNLSDEQIEYAKVIQNSGQGLLALINEILDLSKIEAGKMDMAFEDVFVHDVVKNLSSIFQPLAQEKEIGFTVDIDTDVPGSIHTDSMRLEQVLKNLISNALKFTSHGSVGLHVAMKDKKIAFTVTDTGIGIAPDKQQLIFEAFQQEDGSTRRKYGGTGLGLSISRELAKLLGGDISLTSEPGKGSSFTLQIPTERNAGYNAGEAVQQPVARSQEDLPVQKTEDRYISEMIPPDVPDDRKTIRPNDKVILIVEDDTNFAKSLIDFTRKQGYKAVASVRGDEAVELAKRYHPAGILMDIQLPIKDGLEAMDDLKNDPATRHIPVHMMSSHEMKMKSLSKGAIDFISKPVAFEKMQDIFQKLEYVLTKNPQKVLIVEENSKHAKALAYFLETYHVNSEIKTSVSEGIKALNNQDVNCVILDMELPAQNAYETLEQVKKTPGMEHLPIIVFTGKSLSRAEEQRIKQYADSIVVKTAYSYQRIIDEVSIFLHLVEETTRPADNQYKKLGMLQDVLKDKTVLIADDDVRNIYSLTRALENMGMSVVSALDGKEALKKLEETPAVDVVLMDMMMPEMDGYTSIQEIRKQFRYRELPIIAVTAKAMLGDREKCINAGASDYITKPVDIDQLLSLLRVWLYDASA